MGDQFLARGDVVRVRAAREILRTLDNDGALDAMPFMPEMIRFIGQQFTVASRTTKVCDTINGCTHSRELPNVVLLEGARCDGGGHGGCQAQCLVYWNERWLERIDDATSTSVTDSEADIAELRALVEQQTTRASDDGAVRYRCQATEMATASQPLSTVDPRPYFREYRNGNVPFRRFVRVLARAIVLQIRNKLRLLDPHPLRGDSRKSPPAEPLDLQPGEWVRVKTADEIRRNLTDEGKNRGLWFDREMLAFCGGTYRVRERVSRIIDDRNGELIEFGNECISLEDVVCSGDYSVGRWFCPRAIFPYWREAWLERTEVSSAAVGGATAAVTVRSREPHRSPVG